MREWCVCRVCGCVYASGVYSKKTLTNLEELDFSYRYHDSPSVMRYSLPPSALRFAPTLHVSKIGFWHFPNEITLSLNFPLL